jgi:hypothetical protein
MTSSISGPSCTVWGAEFELAGVNLREVEHLFDEAEQVGSGAMHALMALSGVRSSWLTLDTNCDFVFACPAPARVVGWAHMNATDL